LDVYDFYKPNHSEYAAVDGKLSQWAYLSSVDACYKRYKQKYYKKHGILPSESVTKISQDHFDYFAFHSPYNKLVQKGFARIIYTDFLESPTDPKYSSLVSFQDMPIDDTYESKEVETACRVLSNPL
jgi:hydroxymethylglutaryl-CoA synthase